MSQLSLERPRVAEALPCKWHNSSFPSAFVFTTVVQSITWRWAAWPFVFNSFRFECVKNSYLFLIFKKVDVRIIMLDNQYLRHLLYRGLDLQGKGSLETCEILSVVPNCGVYQIAGKNVGQSRSERSRWNCGARHNRYVSISDFCFSFLVHRIRGRLEIRMIGVYSTAFFLCHPPFETDTTHLGTFVKTVRLGT